MTSAALPGSSEDRWCVEGDRALSWMDWQADDVLLETLRIAGGRVLRASAHAARMLAAAERRGVAETSAAAVAFMVGFAPGCQEGALRWYLPIRPPASAPRWALHVSAWQPPERAWARGVSLATVDIPHPRDGAWGKSAQRRPWKIARAQALAREADEGLLLDGDRALESDSGALLWRMGGVWHAVDAAAGVLPSVTLAALAPQMAVRFMAPPLVETLLQAEGVALVSALRLAVGVASINGTRVHTDLDEIAAWRRMLERA